MQPVQYIHGYLRTVPLWTGTLSQAAESGVATVALACPDQSKVFEMFPSRTIPDVVVMANQLSMVSSTFVPVTRASSFVYLSFRLGGHILAQFNLSGLGNPTVMKGPT